MNTENTESKQYESLTNGLGITGLVLGILTLLVSFIPCIGMLAIVIGVISVVISLSAFVIASKHNYAKGLIIAGLITALLGCAIAYTQYAAISNAGTEAVKNMQEGLEELDKEMEKSKKELEELNKETKEEAKVTEEIQKELEKSAKEAK